MRDFGVFFNPNYRKKEEVFHTIKKLHSESNFEFYALKKQMHFMPDFIKEKADKKIDSILTFGGDGTILRAVDFALQCDAPLLGINLGKLGFLSDIDLPELKSALKKLTVNDFKIQKRMLLHITLRRGRKDIYKAVALNDAIVYKGSVARLIDVRLYYNKLFALETRCDGVIASTPTGSTAYSLSAGGPILFPEMEAIIVAPLNPHVLSVRPMVFSSQETITFKVVNALQKAILQIDGENVEELQDNDRIVVKNAEKKIGFIKLTNKTFYQILRKKLHLGKI